jgi:DNA (cytosine-5)-methyltransferase 1
VPQRYFLSAHSLRGDPAPRRESGQRPAPTLSARTKGGGGLGTDFDIDGGLIPERARALTTSNQRIDAETETLLVTHSLRADGFDASEDGTGRGTPLVVADTLRGHPRPGSNTVGAIAFGAQNSARQGASASEHVTPTLDKSKTPGVGIGMQVRRLTPRECERLQGFPDDYTRIPLRNAKGLLNGKWAKDGPRYKALGNSMAVPVMAWIGRRIATVDAIDG